MGGGFASPNAGSVALGKSLTPFVGNQRIVPDNDEGHSM